MQANGGVRISEGNAVPFHDATLEKQLGKVDGWDRSNGQEVGESEKRDLLGSEQEFKG